MPRGLMLCHSPTARGHLLLQNDPNTLESTSVDPQQLPIAKSVIVPSVNHSGSRFSVYRRSSNGGTIEGTIHHRLGRTSSSVSRARRKINSVSQLGDEGYRQKHSFQWLPNRLTISSMILLLTRFLCAFHPHMTCFGLFGPGKTICLSPNAPRVEGDRSEGRWGTSFPVSAPSAGLERWKTTLPGACANVGAGPVTHRFHHWWDITPRINRRNWTK